MASITIKYVEPVAPVEGDVQQICAFFLPTSSYVDGVAYDGTQWDTNVWDDFAGTEDLIEYLSKITNTPNVLILFKAAIAAGDEGITFEETDPKKVVYYQELGKALEPYGFEVTVDGGDVSE